MTPSAPCCNSSPCSSTARSSMPGCWSSPSGSSASSALLGDELEPDAIIDRLLDDGLAETTASFGAILLLDGGSLRLAGATLSGQQRHPRRRPARSALAVRPGRSYRRAAVPSRRHRHQAVRRGARPPVPRGVDHARGRSSRCTATAGRSESSRCASRSRSRSTPRSSRSSSRSATVSPRHSNVVVRSPRSATARREAELATERVSGMRELATDLSRATTRRGVAGDVAALRDQATGAAVGWSPCSTGGPTRSNCSPPSVPARRSAERRTCRRDCRRRRRPRCRCTRAPSTEPALPEPIVEQLRADQVRSVATYPLTSGSRQIGETAARLVGTGGPGVRSRRAACGTVDDRTGAASSRAVRHRSRDRRHAAAQPADRACRGDPRHHLVGALPIREPWRGRR